MDNGKEQWERRKRLNVTRRSPCESRKKSDPLPICCDTFDRVHDGPDLREVDGLKEDSDEERDPDGFSSSTGAPGPWRRALDEEVPEEGERPQRERRYPPQKGELRTLENHDEVRDVEEISTVDAREDETCVEETVDEEPSSPET